jgi:hypothetical protein
MERFFNYNRPNRARKGRGNPAQGKSRFQNGRWVPGSDQREGPAISAESRSQGHRFALTLAPFIHRAGGFCCAVAPATSSASPGASAARCAPAIPSQARNGQFKAKAPGNLKILLLRRAEAR